MSKVEIEIPDDRWFLNMWQFRPKDGQVCAVLTNEMYPIIGKYIKSSNEFQTLSKETRIIWWSWVRYWMPLVFPEEYKDKW